MKIPFVATILSNKHETNKLRASISRLKTRIAREETEGEDVSILEASREKDEESLEELNSKLAQDTRFLEKAPKTYKALKAALKDPEAVLRMKMAGLKAKIARLVSSRLMELERVNCAVIKAKSGILLLNSMTCMPVLIFAGYQMFACWHISQREQETGHKTSPS